MKKRIISIALAVMLVLTAAMSVAPAEKAQAANFIGNCRNCWGSHYNNTVEYHYTMSTPYGSYLYYELYTGYCSICGLYHELYILK